MLPGRAPAVVPRTVSIDPGETQFTVLRCAASSIARPRVRPSRPALAAQTWTRFLVPPCVEMPPIVTIPPPPAPRLFGTPARPQLKAHTGDTERLSPHTATHTQPHGAWRR